MTVGQSRAQSGNPSLDRALRLYRSIEDDYVRAIEATGAAFALRDEDRLEARDLLARLEAAGARIRNGGASVSYGFLSTGCVACTSSAASRTYAISNNCHRDCFFCFNPNEEDFAYYCEHEFPWRENLDGLAANGVEPACLALSGGEPLLYFDEACAYFERCRELFPSVHTRIYTSGDLLSTERLARLRAAGLDEIRFSVKQSDPDEMVEKLLGLMREAVAKGFTVMVEMPPIPGTENRMRDLLRRLDDAGVHGINLLEFAYPMWNWQVFASLGLALRNPPSRVLYDYSYAGSLAVDGAEELCLRLMLWAIGEGLSLGLHYCSIENKHRAQVRNINEPHMGIDPRYAFDYGDYFLKAGVVFGPDRRPVRHALAAAGCRDFLEDDEGDSTAFHPRWLPLVDGVRRENGEAVCPCVSTAIAIAQGDSFGLRELKVERVVDAALIDLDDRTAASDEAANCSLSGYLKKD